MNPPNKQIESVNNPLMRCVSTFDGSRTSAADYKLIPLTQGLFAIVDVEDFEWLNQYKQILVHYTEDTRRHALIMGIATHLERLEAAIAEAKKEGY